MKRVLWLCTFDNVEKMRHLKCWSMRSSGERGQWIPNLLSAFKDDPEWEVHVASSSNFMVSPYQSWEDQGIRYHCYKSGIPILGRNWPARFPVDQATRFWLNRRRIARIVKRVKPDLIHLFGVENPQYGAAVLDLLGRYPVLVTIQGFIHRERAFHDDAFTRCRCHYEDRLLKACHHFSGDYDSEQVVKRINPGVTYQHVYFPVNEVLIAQTPHEERLYDVLFVGALTVQKGVFDFLKVVQILARDFTSLRAAIVGSPASNPAVAAWIEEQGLAGHIVWIGRFPSQSGLFKVFRQSRLLLTPTYNDAFPSTIRESMLLGTPVIAYQTGGIPWANRNGQENVAIVSQGNWMLMAERAKGMLDDQQVCLAIADRARAFAEQEYSLKVNVAAIRSAYCEMVGKNELSNSLV